MYPELETPRLRLRPLRPGDEEFLASLECDPSVMQHIHQGPIPYDEAIRYACSQVEMARYRRLWGKWLVEWRGGAVALGWVELAKLSGRHRDDLHEYAPSHWGRGYATEAAGRVNEYAFEVVDLDRIAAVARPANVASVRVLEKLGFRSVGRRQDDGVVWCTEYRLTGEEWRRDRQGREALN